MMEQVGIDPRGDPIYAVAGTVRIPPQPDSRGSWPSASAAQANKLCPGRHTMQLRAQEQFPETEKQDPDAEAGQAIHAAWCNKPTRDLEPDEQETLDRFKELEMEILRSWIEIGTQPECQREVRLWHKFPKGGRILECSGQADVLYISGTRALIIDGKRGRKAVTHEPENLQLRWLAALAFVSLESVLEVTVALAQHWSKANPPCVYDLDDLVNSALQMERQVVACHEPNAPRVPSQEACEWCRAKKICPEFLEASMPPPRVISGAALMDGAELPSPKQHYENCLARMTGDQLGYFLPMLRMCAEVAELEVRARLTRGDDVKGWKLSPGRTVEKITDPQTVFSRFMQLPGASQSAFHETVTVGKGKLSEIVGRITGERGMGLKLKVSGLLDGATELKQSSEILERD